MMPVVPSRFFQSSPQLRILVFQSLSRPFSTLPPPRQDSLSAEVQPNPLSPETFPPLPYHVHRTASQQLPVYHLAKRGGNLHQTRIRKIGGDIKRLRDDLQAALGLKDEHVVINQLTKQVIIKGWYRENVKRFLETQHF